MERDAPARDVQDAAPSGAMPLRELGQCGFERQRKKLRKHLRAVSETHDAEAIHKLRITLRRLRIQLRVLAEADLLAGRKARKLNREVRDLSKLLGRVRDLELLLANIMQDAEAHPERASDFAALRDSLAQQRATLWNKLLHSLDQPTIQRLPERLKTLTQRLAEQQAGANVPDTLVRHAAGSALWRRYEAILRYETVVAEAPQPTLHQLRIACKHLRYALEMFEDALGDGVQQLLETLIAFQRLIGAMQDDTSALTIVETAQRQEPNNPTLKDYAQCRDAGYKQLRAQVAPFWEGLSGATFRNELAALIARL